MTTEFDSERQQRLNAILDTALAHDARDWPVVVEAACQGDAGLRAEAMDLLRRVDAAASLLVSPPAAAAAAAVAEAQGRNDAWSGRRIGAYSIIREIGRGGMSRVFLAQRADGHFEQQVALKLLRPGLDTEVDRARFRTERQIVASLNHPGIARLIDGGLTDEGQPYLVLEFVDGEPIDEYCDAHGLSVRQRVSLFLDVARATQFAHRNLVVHRDIKTSNILVDEAGTVKLLDFGLARMLEPRFVAAAVARPETVGHWMTPEYAAPEQIRRGRVTTLTDVYQLGVVLYRILSDSLPFTSTGDLHELEAAVLRGDPAPPSAAVVARDRSRARLLRGDLDAIVLKALRTEPDERFASVEAFSDDLRRYLSGHPVRARRSTGLYSARRFVRRHRIETVATAGVTLSILLGAGIALTQARRAAAERDAAAAASRESQAVTAFVMGLFEINAAAEARTSALTAADLVERAAARADAMHEQPLAQAEMLEVTGRLYQGLGRTDDAFEMYRRALDIRRHSNAGRSIEVARTLDERSSLYLYIGRYAAADSDAREALRIETLALGPDDPALAVTLHQLGTIAIARGDLRAADTFHRQALETRERSLGSGDSLTALSHLTYGAMLRREGRQSEAEQEFRSGLATLEKTVSPDNPHIAEALLQIAYLLDQEGSRYAAAEPFYRRALEIRKRAFGADHPMVAATLLDLAEFLSRRGDTLAAVAPARQGMAIINRAYKGDHPVAVYYSSRLAVVLEHAGQLDDAAALLRLTIDANRRLRGAEHEVVAGLDMELTRLLITRRQFAEADSAIGDAIRIRRNAQGSSSPATAAAVGLFGRLLAREGHYVAADSVLRGALLTMEKQVGRGQHDVREMYGWLADVDDARGLHDQAARYRAIANAR